MFFSRKPKAPKVEYIAYVSKMAKYRNVMTSVAASPHHTLLIYFFEDTAKEVIQMAKALNIHLKSASELRTDRDVTMISAFELNSTSISPFDEIVCIEVHPFSSINSLVKNAFMSAPDQVIKYYLGMDEMAIRIFAGERVINLMHQLGIKEDEPIEHSMVSKSIERGLEKLEAKYPNAKDIRTNPEDWATENGVESYK
ncbi:MAG: hypothetical protein RIC35_17555 [Marinoscillum sp.]